MAIKVPGLFGIAMNEEGNEPFYFRNISLFVFPLLALYFVWNRGSGIVRALC